MKKLNYLIVLVFTAGLFVGCEEDSTYRDAYVGSDVMYFTSSSTNFFITSNSSTIELKVVTTSTSNSDRSFEVEVDEENSTASNDYVLSSNTFTIPADSYQGTIELGGNFDNASEDGTKLILNLKSGVDVVDNMGSNTSIEVNIYKLCESNLAGEYTMTTTYGYHDFLPSFNPNTIDVELEAVTENTYEVLGDFTGGLWGDLYAGEYNTSPREGVVITDICSVISWDQTAHSDQFGGTIIYGDTTSYVDPETGNIYLSWVCTGYGESGVAVLEPK
jgi:hypothetical protein